MNVLYEGFFIPAQTSSKGAPVLFTPVISMATVTWT